jgi:DNA-binding MarR family transcriptional regulator
MVAATPASRGLRADVEAVWAELEERTVAGLDEQERATVVRVLGRLEANLAAGDTS